MVRSTGLEPVAFCSASRRSIISAEISASIVGLRLIKWCARQDLNLWPSAPQADALSTELRAQKHFCAREAL